MPPLPHASSERLRRYAELAVSVGANVQAGQEVVVLCQVEHAPTARAVVREAYRAGAQRVVVRYADQHVRRAAIELGPEDMLGRSPEHMLAWIRSWRETRPALISAHRRRRAGASRRPRIRLSSGSPSPMTSVPSTSRSSPSASSTGSIVAVAEPRLGDDGVRRARSRAPVGGRRHRDTPRRSRSRRRLAGARREAEGAFRPADRATIRRRPVPRTGHGPCRRPAAGSSLDMCRVHDHGGHRPHPEPADRGGVHLARLAPHRGCRALDDAALRHRRRRPRSRGSVQERQGRRGLGVGRRGDHPEPARGRPAGGLSRRGGARRRRLGGQEDGARLPEHAVRRERDLPHRLRHGRADGGRRSRRPRHRTNSSRSA